MFSFLQPIWLYAIAGIIAPIAIHFWNIKERKAFPVGSIALLEKNTKKYTRTLRINEWLLLLLRCLLIIFLACLLAKPVKQQTFGQQKGWILLDKQNTNTVYRHFKTVIDSLLNKGYELHRFDESFEQTNLKDGLIAEDTATNKISYWSLIKKADDELQPSFPVYVFTSNYLNNFKGVRPKVNANIKWFVYVADTAVKQIAKAWRTNDNSIRVMLVNSTPSGNMPDYEDLPATQEANNEYKISSNNGLLSIAYNNQQPVIVDTTIMRINIYAGKYRQDANYIKASLDAIEQFTKRNIQISTVTNITPVPQQNDWLFWLSNEPVPKNIIAKNIVKYEQGKEQAISSIIDIGEPITIKKRIAADSLFNVSSTLLWKDGFGGPLLTKENIDGAVVYHFYSRFNPQWNDLVWSDAFPKILLQLLFADEANNINKTQPDVRTVDERQIQPVFVNNFQKKVSTTTADLSTTFWVIIFLLFCAERIVSFKTRSTLSA